MKAIHAGLAVVFLVTLLGVAFLGDAQGTAGRCTVRDRIALGQAGYTKAEIGDFCDQDADQIPASGVWGILAGEGQPRWVQWCVTPQGRCSLNPATSGYYPVGSPCNCYMPWGSYGGVAQ